MWNDVKAVRCPKCKGQIYKVPNGELRCESCDIKVEVRLLYDKPHHSYTSRSDEYLFLECKEVED